MTLADLIASYRTTKDAVVARDWGAVFSSVEKFSRMMKDFLGLPQAMNAQADPVDTTELDAAVAELKSACEAPIPMAATGDEAVPPTVAAFNPANLVKLFEFMQLAADLWKRFK